MNFLKTTFFWSLIVGLLFFIAATLTLKDYGIMWDARTHFLRGQAYSYFFLTGKTTYGVNQVTSDFVRYYRDYLSRSNRDYSNLLNTLEDIAYRRSIYRDNLRDFVVYESGSGHPPLSDIGAAIFNDIFYEKLGLLRDDLGYNLFAVFLSSILVGLVFYWMKKSYGIFPAVISTLTLSTYPLFWAESHFNIKDIPSMVFFALAVWAFWKGVISKLKKWIILSSILAGFAFATKFNVVFLPFIVIPWFLIYYFKQSNNQRRVYHKWWWLIPIYPAIMLFILFATYPYLWPHPWQNFLNVIAFYKNIGTNIDYTPYFRTIFGFNTYPLIWVASTTYPWVIVLSFIGGVSAFFGFSKEKYFLPPLFLLWLFIPILRVSVPQSAIYDGVRQIMEYIPALSLLSGYGAYVLLKLIPQRLKLVVFSLMLVAFLPLIFTLVRFHPAENAYFNSLIGGLKGARDKQLTGWGNTDGGIYAVAVNWLNKNAQKNSHVATVFSDTADFYIPALRKDLLADNQFSGYLQKGEYLVALTHNSGLEQTYRMLYPEKFLEPLFVFEIDGVPLIKIWKNDKKYLKSEFAKMQDKVVNLLPQRKDNILYWDLEQNKSIMRIEINFANSASCQSLTNAYFQISSDGQTWGILPETYPGGVIDFLGNQPNKNMLIAPFAGISARFISLVTDPSNACVLNAKKSLVYIEVRQ